MTVRDRIIEYLQGPENAFEVGKVYERKTILEMISAGSGVPKLSAELTDYLTYNSVDRKCLKKHQPFFVKVDKGEYKYVGENYAYWGELKCFNSNGDELLVGTWSDGKLNYNPQVVFDQRNM